MKLSQLKQEIYIATDQANISSAKSRLAEEEGLPYKALVYKVRSEALRAWVQELKRKEKKHQARQYKKANNDAAEDTFAPIAYLAAPDADPAQVQQRIQHDLARSRGRPLGPGHHAGIRPTMLDRRPVLGRHPEYPSLYVYNGLGTKGYMLAPLLSKEMADFILTETAVDKEVSLGRFSK